MSTDLETSIRTIVARASSEMAQSITAAVRASIGEQIVSIIGPEILGLAKRGPGRPPKAAAKAAVKAAVAAPEHKAAAPAPAAKGKRAKPGKVHRRSSQQVAADDARILAFVQGHPGLRSVAMQKQLGMPRQNLASGLERLREDGKVKAKGARSATSYTAA